MMELLLLGCQVLVCSCSISHASFHLKSCLVIMMLPKDAYEGLQSKLMVHHGTDYIIFTHGDVFLDPKCMKDEVGSGIGGECEREVGE